MLAALRTREVCLCSQMLDYILLPHSSCMTQGRRLILRSHVEVTIVDREAQQCLRGGRCTQA